MTATPTVRSPKLYLLINDDRQSHQVLLRKKLSKLLALCHPSWSWAMCRLTLPPKKMPLETETFQDGYDTQAVIHLVAVTGYKPDNLRARGCNFHFRQIGHVYFRAGKHVKQEQTLFPKTLVRQAMPFR